MADQITGTSPADERREQAALVAALDRVIPAKRRARNLLIGTRNVRGFDRATAKWRSQSGDSSIRDLSNILCIAEVETVLKKQFARTPYAASFICGSVPFTLVTLHVTWGQRPADWVPELEEIGLWLARWAKDRDPWGTNLIALGDFNIDRRDDPTTPTPEAPPNHRNFCDQIAWFRGAGGVPR